MEGVDRRFQEAARNGDLAAVSSLLDAGADYNQVNSDSTTAAWWAAANGHNAVVRLLMERGADFNVSNKQGWSAFVGACIHSVYHPQCIRVRV